MFSNKILKERCFLCSCQPESKNNLKNAKKITCPGSKKLLRDVIKYLANSAQMELNLSEETLLCLGCCRKVMSFDENMVKIMKQKRELLDSIQKAMTKVDSDFEVELQEFTLKEEEEESLSDKMGSDDEVQIVLKSKTLENYETEKERAKNAWSKFNAYVCHICEQRLLNKKELESHMDQEHKKYNCDMCNFAHHNENQVILHKNVHQGLKETQCPICHKEFTKKISTIRHMESHTDLQKYQCDKCGLRFSQSTVFNNHKMRHDAEENPLFCKICRQQFKTIKTYRRHAITHRSDRPRYPCEHCQKSFADKYTLKVHKRIHKVDDNYTQEDQQNISLCTDSANQLTCIICDQAFINKEQLDKHMEEDHDVILTALYSHS